MLLGSATVARAADCPGNANAIGTSRTIVVDPREHGRIGTMDYEETLPLNDREVVLTFDDGPLPPYTNQILKILASECVLANYFIVGQMAKAYPDAVKKVYEAGHTIGTHSWSHPLKFRAQSNDRAKFEIDQGIAATAAALGDASHVAPFFRFPGFGHTNASEEYLASQGIMVWGADAPADDWHKISASEIARRAIRRLEAKGKGILLLHDIHARTVDALPIILREMKERGFRIVHVVPASPEHPATATVASAWRLHSRPGPVAPVIMIASIQNLDAESLAKLNAAQMCELPAEPETTGSARSSRRFGRGLHQARLHREAKLQREMKPTHETRKSSSEAPIKHAGHKRNAKPAKPAKVAGVDARLPIGNSHAIE